MKIREREIDGQKETLVKVVFHADKDRITHAVAVLIDSGRSLHEITSVRISESLFALFEANGNSVWIKPSDEAMAKAVVKVEDMFPGL